jgi:hypothetical protein
MSASLIQLPLPYPRPPDKRRTPARGHATGALIDRAGKADRALNRTTKLGRQGDHPGWRVRRHDMPAIYLALLSVALREANR